MKLKKLLLFIPLFLFFINGLKSQNNTIPQTVKRTFFYSFENVVNESQIENLKNDIYALRGVSEVKSEYKSENKRGQVVVVVIEKQRSSEKDVLFDIKALKDAIIKNNLSPFELTQEESIIEN